MTGTCRANGRLGSGPSGAGPVRRSSIVALSVLRPDPVPSPLYEVINPPPLRSTPPSARRKKRRARLHRRPAARLYCVLCSSVHPDRPGLAVAFLGSSFSLTRIAASAAHRRQPCHHSRGSTLATIPWSFPSPSPSLPLPLSALLSRESPIVVVPPSRPAALPFRSPPCSREARRLLRRANSTHNGTHHCTHHCTHHSPLHTAPPLHSPLRSPPALISSFCCDLGTNNCHSGTGLPLRVSGAFHRAALPSPSRIQHRQPESGREVAGVQPRARSPALTCRQAHSSCPRSFVTTTAVRRAASVLFCAIHASRRWLGWSSVCQSIHTREPVDGRQYAVDVTTVDGNIGRERPPKNRHHVEPQARFS